MRAPAPTTAAASGRRSAGCGAILRRGGTTALLVVLGAPAALAWVPHPLPALGPRRALRERRHPALPLARGPAPSEESGSSPEEPEAGEDCNSSPDGECEIDWDKMFPESAAEDSDDMELDAEPGRALGAGAALLEAELRTLAAQARDPVARRAAEVDPAQARVSLEMAWQLQEQQDECEVERPDTCSDLCQTCRGAGAVPCRFCHGTKVLALAGMAAAKACPICSARGSEPCGACRGSGWIADWTQLRRTAQTAL